VKSTSWFAKICACKSAVTIQKINFPLKRKNQVSAKCVFCVFAAHLIGFMENILVGRQKELRLLRDLRQKSSASFVAVYGRRRAGKTYLIRSAFDHQFTFQLTVWSRVVYLSIWSR
jgi:hypothetical protein